MGLNCGGNWVVPTEHPGRRASAQTLVECSGPLLEVPVQGQRAYTSPKAKAKLGSPSSGDMCQEGPR